MGKLEGIVSLTKTNRDKAAASIAPVEAANKALQRVLDDVSTSIGLQKALDGLTKVIGGLPGYAEELEAIHSQIKREFESMPQYSDDAVQALIREQIASQDLLRKQISSIKIPTPDKVDLSALLEAVANLKTLVANIRPPAEIPEQKTYWTFDIVRNRTTGLIEKVEAR